MTALAQKLLDGLGLGEARERREQILGKQDPLYLVLVPLGDHRVAGVAALGHGPGGLLERGVKRDGHHLQAGDHDLAHALAPHVEDALDHVLSVAAYDLAPARVVDYVLKLLYGLGLAGAQEAP